MKNPDYTFGIASVEIIILLLVAFILGILLCSLLRKLGICCANQGNDDNEYHTRRSPPPDRSGGYTADIHSLLRSSDTGNNAAERPRAGLSPVSVGLSAAATGISGITSNILQLGEGRKDDLKKLEGIGPKIEQVLNTAGIQNFDQLAALTPEVIKPLLDNAGGQFKMHDPKSWPYQAELAAKGDWERLKEYQNLLIGGQGG
ncbi:hypothetical protein [Candidatus Thiothrix anitrata]|uniref:DUF4332 domain-containing protein n=1 Tax=Candidatus Thiothrix anitrata TaxID=2823902 RepID=A0ABX7WYP6_9GAMM|nr:hypothetical protein [Candidatus Thiothrix anitrata]QTR48770.1 hypothetical protein J8380_10760 [Candidatus Thiothrix anitrata]